MAQRPLFAAAPLVIRLPPTCLGKRWDVAGVSPSLPRTLGNRCSSWSPASGDCGDSKAAGARSLSVSLYLWPCLPPGTASCCSPSHRSHTGPGQAPAACTAIRLSAPAGESSRLSQALRAPVTHPADQDGALVSGSTGQQARGQADQTRSVIHCFKNIKIKSLGKK